MIRVVLKREWGIINPDFYPVSSRLFYRRWKISAFLACKFTRVGFFAPTSSAKSRRKRPRVGSSASAASPIPTLLRASISSRKVIRWFGPYSGRLVGKKWRKRRWICWSLSSSWTSDRFVSPFPILSSFLPMTCAWWRKICGEKESL